MTKLSTAQAAILSEAAKSPASCITTFMKDIKNPMIRQKSLDSMLAKGVINKRFSDRGEEIYLISDAGHEAVGNTQKQSVTPCNAEKQDVTPSNEPKRETKQTIIISLLSREEGATLAELIDATGWKPHSVRGHLSNMRKKHGVPVQAFTNSDGKRGYQILPEDQEAA